MANFITPDDLSLLIGHKNYKNFWNDQPNNYWKKYWDFSASFMLYELFPFFDQVIKKVTGSVPISPVNLASIVGEGLIVNALDVLMSGFFDRDPDGTILDLNAVMKSSAHERERWWSMVVICILLCSEVLYRNVQRKSPLSMEKRETFLKELTLILHDESYGMAGSAAYILAEVNDEQALRALATSAGLNEYQKTCVIHAIEKLRDPALYPLLADFIEENEYLAMLAIFSAERLIGKKYRLFKRKKWIRYLRG